MFYSNYKRIADCIAQGQYVDPTVFKTTDTVADFLDYVNQLDLTPNKVSPQISLPYAHIGISKFLMLNKQLSTLVITPDARIFNNGHGLATTSVFSKYHMFVEGDQDPSKKQNLRGRAIDLIIVHNIRLTIEQLDYINRVGAKVVYIGSL